MPIDQNKYDIIDQDEEREPTLEDELLARVNRDFASATIHCSDWHTFCVDARGMYHNASEYINLKLTNRFPMPIVQEFVDMLVAHLRDKLVYTNRPCSVIGVEDTDKADADAKQGMIDWQDYKDGMNEKIAKGLRDAARYDSCIAQVDYVEHKRKQWQVVEVEQDDPDNQTWLQRVTGEMPKKMVPEWQRGEVVTYRGPEVRIINPTDFYVTGDKQVMNDPFPVMIKSKQSRGFFDSQPYFFNQTRLDTDSSSGVAAVDPQKKEMTDQPSEHPDTARPHTYVEWQCPIKKVALAEFKGEDIEGIEPTELVWVICGVVDSLVVVRLDEQEHGIDGPNIVVGSIEKDDAGLLGIGLVRKIAAMHKASQVTMGQLLENFNQSTNRMFGLNTKALMDKAPIVNRAGGVIQTNQDPRTVIYPIEAAPISRDLYELLVLYRQMVKDSSGLQDNVAGKGDRNAETLGEANIADIHASMRLRDYLKTFEDTFVQPLYDMRNQINMEMLDQEYVYGVIGEAAFEWRSIDPTQIRANVDFVCESSMRESNRAVMAQQMLHLIKLAPAAIRSGQPVRIDKMMAKLCEGGFSLKRAEVRDFYPLLKMEENGQIPVDELMVQGALLQLQIQAGQIMPPGMGPEGGAPGGGNGGPMPSPTTEQGAVESANQAEQTKVG